MADNEVRESKPRRISLAWIIPLIALVVTGIMLWENTLNKGSRITVSIPSADGIEEGRTMVKYRSVPVGRVEDVNISEDLKSVDLDIQMDPGTEKLLVRDSQFWVVKPRVQSMSVSGLDTLISGSYLQISLGKSEEITNNFVALSEPPLNPYNEPGTAVNLFSEAGELIKVGTIVTYRGIEVGMIESARLNPANSFLEYRIFVRAPYDQLLKGNTYFWIDSGIDLSIDGTGINLKTGSLMSVLAGAVAFDSVGYQKAEEKLNTDEEIRLYNSYTEAETAALAKYPRMVVLARDNFDDISKGAEVYYRGSVVGRVLELPWVEDEWEIPDPDKPMAALIAIYTNSYETDRLVKGFIDVHMLEGSLCAVGYSNSLLTGISGIELQIREPGSCVSSHATWRGMPVVPYMSSKNDPAEMMAELMGEIKSMKLGETTAQLRSSLMAAEQSLTALSATLDEIGQKEIVGNFRETMEGFRTSLNQFKQTMKTYDRSGDIHQGLRRILSQLEQIERNLTPATRQIGQKPNSIIFSDTSDDVQPGGRK